MSKLQLTTIMAVLILVACSEKEPSSQQTDKGQQDTLSLDTLEQDTIPADTVSQDTVRADSTISYETIGSIEKISEDLDNFIAPGTEIEILADGFTWSEGPVWVEAGGYVLFSDVPENRVHKWKEREGLSTYLEPSGYTGEGFYSGEPGSNGLFINDEDQLILCQHGNRQIARMNSPIDYPNEFFASIADHYDGKKFNSPNDLAIHEDGSIYFTDPIYGLPGRENSTIKELDFSGVFRVGTEGEVSLLTDQLSYPNGIAFSPDYSICYVTVSDFFNPVIMAYPIQSDGSFDEGAVFFNAAPLKSDGPGLTDGLAVHPSGTLFSTGPGGVLIIDAEGNRLGTIKTTQATANCTFNADYSHLYMTADRYLLRVAITQ